MTVCDACGRPAVHVLDVEGARPLHLCEEHWRELVEDYILDSSDG